MITSTESVVQHHLQAVIERNLVNLLYNYSDASIFITPDAIFFGAEEIGNFYSALFANLPEGFNEKLQLNKMEVTGELAYLIWDSKPWFPFASDTFVVRDGKIAYHTYASPAKE
jgi:hypothetical protein